MQRIRETLVGSTLAFALTAAGVAAAEGNAETRSSASRPAADAAHSKAPATAAPSEERIMSMQRALLDRGLYRGRVDGVLGPQTEAALREFQHQNGLAPTGQLNLSTANALGINGERQAVSGTDAPVSSGSAAKQAEMEDGTANVQLSSLRPEQAKEMQQRLQLLGYYRGEIDGVLGSGTRTALERFFRHQADLATRGIISNAAIGMFGTEVQEVPQTEPPATQR